MTAFRNSRGWAGPGAVLALLGVLATLAAVSGRDPAPQRIVAPSDTSIALGWISNIARNQGADSLEQLMRVESPGANTVVLGTGGFYSVLSTTSPARNHFMMDSSWAGRGDPNINQFTFARALEAAHRLGLKVIVGLPFESEVRRKLANVPGYEGAYSPLDSLERCVRFVLDHTAPGDLAGWYVGDEPNLGVGYPGDPSRSARYARGVLDSMVAHIRSVDADVARHPIIPILFGAPERALSAGELKDHYLGRVADAFMVDAYLGGLRPDFTVNRDAAPARLEALARNVAPAMRASGARWYAVLQGWNISAPYCNFDRWYRCGTSLPEGEAGSGAVAIQQGGAEVDSVESSYAGARAQLRYQALSSLAGGARGVLFFGGVPRDSATQTGTPYATAGFRRRAVAPVLRLLGCSPIPGEPLTRALERGRDASAGVSPGSGQDVHFSVRETGGLTGVFYLIASNDGSREEDCAWDVGRLGADLVMAEVLGGDGPSPGDTVGLKLLRSRRGRFEDRLAPHSAKIYVIGPGAALPALLPPSGALGAEPAFYVSVSPNPSRSVSRIRFQSARAGSGMVRIFDAAGRAIRSWSVQLAPGGSSEVSWDGSSGHGEPLAGVFFCRVQTPSGLQTLKLLRVR